jgi:lipopolysaccharide biosynthesis glycosyltransferase
MTTHVVSVFDKNYLCRALALYRSVASSLPDAQTWYLCLDDESKKIIEELRLPMLFASTLSDINDTELESTRKDRSAGEFAFTAKSAWLDHLSKTGRFTNGDLVIFADADVLFYPPIKSFAAALPSFSIALSPHDFPDKEKYREALYGRYNAGMVCFIYDEISKECMSDWRKDTIAWCYARSEDGKFADQMYLDHWSKRYERVIDIAEPGFNLGPWNDSKYKHVHPLFSYHFHGLKFYLDKKGSARPILINTRLRYVPLYKEYATLIHAALDLIRTVRPSWNFGFAPYPGLLRTIKRTIVRLIKN